MVKDLTKASSPPTQGPLDLTVELQIFRKIWPAQERSGASDWRQGWSSFPLKLDEVDWEVEKIVDHKRSKNGRYRFLVRWLGYGPEDDSWLSENDLEDCQEILEEYRRSEAWLEHIRELQEEREAKAAKKAATQARERGASNVEPSSSTRARKSTWRLPI
jgi:hypothetical protein